MNKILWISSYPKSGNTWLRSIISSLIYASTGEFNFNLLKLIEVFERKKRYEFVKDINLDDYKKLDKEIECISKYWIECQKKIVLNKEINPILNIFKTHSANLTVASNKFTDESLVCGNIYIVRDPREIVISYSKHRGKSIDNTIETMGESGTLLSPDKSLSLCLLSSWEVHFHSWKNFGARTLIIKYEDLINNTTDEVFKISNFLSNIFEIDKKKLDKKIYKVTRSTDINRFRNYEKKFGFNETSSRSSASFFGSAKINSWKKILSDNQINKIENLFNKTMKELGYL